jgi:hypothetical protein
MPASCSSSRCAFRRKLAIILGRAATGRVLAVLDRIDRDIRVYIRIKTTLPWRRRRSPTP